MVQLDLHVVPPPGEAKGGAPKKITVRSSLGVHALKVKIVQDKIVDVPLKDLVVFFQNKDGPFSQRLTHLLEESNLKNEAVSDGAMIVCQRATYDKKVSKGTDSGYYTWAENIPDVPQDLRIQLGGAPKLLSQDKADTAASSPPFRTIAKYTWVDESRQKVKVYISAEDEPAPVAAAGSEADDSLKVEFGERSLKVTVFGEMATHVLSFDELEHPIVPAECKARITEGKRITITLKKAQEDVYWHTLFKRT
mmetsp:Transcript_121766/g.271912  ORF Transcript_121766/g.271912 Transcript_121766/m.271912 type:complete len:251 (-) Transcript_121766:115-867(-)